MISLKFIVFFLIFIIAVHALALVNYWYWTYQWLDIPMHFLGGFWVAMAIIFLISNFQFPISKEFLKENFFHFAITILSFVIFVGVLLEFVEFLYDVFISSRGYVGFLQLGAADTMADLFFDLLGAFVFAIIYRVISKNN
jgi:hypothetical protein